MGGLWQLYASITTGVDGYVAQGVPQTRAEILAEPSVVQTLLFAVNALGGVLGTVLLLLRKALAKPVLGASFGGILAYLAVTAMNGVLGAGGATLLWTLISVGVVSGLLFGLAVSFARRGVLQ